MGQYIGQNVCGFDNMRVPTVESEPVFSEEHSSCESWTVGVGAAKASKIVSDLMKGRAPSRPPIEVTMAVFVEA